MTIQVFRPTLSTEELANVAHSFDTGWLGKGRKVDEFEAAWAKHINADPANVVSVNSCTEGLFTAVRLLGIGPGDEVIIPTIHFVGAAQAVLSVGARPVFCDVDSRTLNVTWQDIKQVTNGKTAAVVLNHYGGVPCNELTRIQDWCIFKSLWLIEDAANAPASTFSGQAVGTFGDIGVWSFDAMKIISTGDGGMMYIRDRELCDKARKQLYLGTSEGSGLSSNKPHWWEFEVEIKGARRSVMNDLAAGIGLEQIQKLPKFLERRKEIFKYYWHNLNGQFSFVPYFDNQSSHYFFWIQTPRRDELARYLREQGIYTTFRYYPLHWAFKTGDSLPNAEKAARETLLLPLHQGLTDSDIEYVCEKVRGFYNE
jgi:dTDP-4-amino-4,6-dideoxygalactose transaminase